VLWSARLHRDGRVLECAALHISAGGARIRIRQRFEIDSTVVLVIDRVGAFPGEIRWQGEIMQASGSWKMLRSWRSACALLSLIPPIPWSRSSIICQRTSAAGALTSVPSGRGR
jgi:hypothetical protein